MTLVLVAPAKTGHKPVCLESSSNFDNLMSFKAILLTVAWRDFSFDQIRKFESDTLGQEG